MATQPITGEVHAFPGIPPMPAVARVLARFDRPTLEAFLTVAIDLLDTMDPDPDLEETDPLEDDDPREQDDPPEDEDADEDDDPKEENGDRELAWHG